jgi:hypothetical protein
MFISVSQPAATPLATGRTAQATWSCCVVKSPRNFSSVASDANGP